LTGVVAGSLAPALLAVIVGTVLLVQGRSGRARWLVIAAGVSSVALLGASVVLRSWEPLLDLDRSGLGYTYDETWVAWLVALGALLAVAIATFVLVAGVIHVVRRPVGSVDTGLTRGSPTSRAVPSSPWRVSPAASQT
jgi:hypothetical protein